MREYAIRLRQRADTFTATLREIAPGAQDSHVTVGAEAIGTAATAPAAMVAAIAAAHIPEIPRPVREGPYGS